MDWYQAVDIYCERTDASFWSEPVNFITNLTFLLAASLLLWELHLGRFERPRGTFALTCVLAAVGIGSALFHSFAEYWALLADALPIFLFALVFLSLWTGVVKNWGLPGVFGSLGVLVGLSYLFVVFLPNTVLFRSKGYFGMWVVLSLLAWEDRRSEGERGLVLAAGIFFASLLFRTLDLPLCAQLPIGTHFLWHILNAALLYQLIRVYGGRKNC